MTVNIVSSETSPPTEAPRSVSTAILRGAVLRCPACGTGRLFERYLKVADRCPSCSTELHHQRADDAPPYFTIFIVGHLVLGGVLSVEQNFAPPVWVQAWIWMPMTVVLSLWLLPRIKGALVGLQWALRMHGFGSGRDPAAPDALDADAPKT